MFVVWNPDRGVCLLVWQRPGWCAPGGARWRCCRVLLAEDVQTLNVGAVPSVTRPDIPGTQGAQSVGRAVVGLGFARRRSCAEGVRPSAKRAGRQVHDARAAEPVQLLGAAAAEVMPKERGVVVVDYFPADVAWVLRPLRMWGFTGHHPQERYRSWDNRVTLRECAPLRAVRCGGWCGCSPRGVAVCHCVWLVTRLHRLVMDEEVVIHTTVVGGLLCFLCVQLDVVLQLCVRPLDGGELHVTYCDFGFQGVVSNDPVELESYRSPEHRFLDLRLPHKAPDLICLRRGRAPSGVLCYGVLQCPRGQVVASLSQRALFEVFPCLRLLEVAGADGVFQQYVYTSSVIPACQSCPGGAVVQARVDNVLLVGVPAAGTGEELRSIMRFAAHVGGGS